jgi:hypothetical protein
MRWQNPVALRSLCPVVGGRAKRIRGELADGTVASFEAGYAILGTPVTLGPSCVFDARNGAFAQTGFEPTSDYAISVGTVFSGRSEASLPRSAGSVSPSKAPNADEVFRMDKVSDLRPTDFGYREETWAFGCTSLTAKQLVDLNARVATTPRPAHSRTPRQSFGYAFRTPYGGAEYGSDRQELGDRPGDSQILKSFVGAVSFSFRGEFFDFDTDCQCGTAWGSIGLA